MKDGDIKHKIKTTINCPYTTKNFVGKISSLPGHPNVPKQDVMW